jgi:hypothetical protein
VATLDQCEANIKNSLHLFDDPVLLNCKGGADFLLNQLNPFHSNLSSLLQHYDKFVKADPVANSEGDKLNESVELFKSLNTFGALISETLISGKITSLTAADLEQGELLSDLCKSAGTSSLALLDEMRAAEKAGHELGKERGQKLDETMVEIVKTLTALLPKVHDISNKEIGDLIEQEMHNTSEAIEAAVAKLEVCFFIIFYLKSNQTRFFVTRIFL